MSLGVKHSLGVKLSLGVTPGAGSLLGQAQPHEEARSLECGAGFSPREGSLPGLVHTWGRFTPGVFPVPGPLVPGIAVTCCQKHYIIGIDNSE